jgi:hypothetical protein
VPVDVGVRVEVGLLVAATVGVRLGVDVAVRVAVGLLVAATVGVRLDVGVAVRVAVLVGDGVLVLVVVGVAVTLAVVIDRLQFTKPPVSKWVSSTMYRFHVPFGFEPLNVDRVVV